MRKPIAFLLAALLLGAPAGCGGDDEAAETAPPEGDLTVMSFNVWYGGASVDFGQVAAAIEAADADIVGVQEPEANLQRIADAAGLQYVDESLHLISRYPLFPAERDGVRFAYAEVARGRVVAVTNAHLTCCPYGPSLVRNGKSAEQVMALERRLRVPEARPYARALAGLAADGIPAFITGDFNSPSHLDWTAEAIAARDLPFELEWPASKAFADAGLRDSYREIHPDPAAEPGLSWTAGTPPPRIRERETLDRIDWVLAAGPSTTVDSRLVGEVGGPDVEVGVSPWGSDHRAVASTFDVEAARAPDLVAAYPRVVPRGERLTIRYALGGSGGGREVGVLPADARDGGEAIETIPIYDGGDHIAPMLSTEILAPGRYAAGLIDADGEILASTPFWVASPDGRPAIATDADAYAPGEPIGVSWRNGPGNKLDWVGVYPAGEPSLYGYLGFVYVDARPAGSLELTRSDIGELEPGRYVASLMLDDGYTILASTPFTVSR